MENATPPTPKGRVSVAKITMKSIDRRRKVDTQFVAVNKGMKIKLNKEWARVNAGKTPKNTPVGLQGVITGFAVVPNCVKVQFDNKKTSQTFHISFLDVQQL